MAKLTLRPEGTQAAALFTSCSTCSLPAYFQETWFQACPFMSKKPSSDCCQCFGDSLVVSLSCSEFLKRGRNSPEGFSLSCPHLGGASFSEQSFWSLGLGQSFWAWPYRKTGNRVLSCFFVLFWKPAKDSSVHKEKQIREIIPVLLKYLLQVDEVAGSSQYEMLLQ